VSGAFLAPIIGWRGLFLVGPTPALLVLMIRYWVPESPRWLMRRPGPSLDETTPPISDQVTMGRRRRLDVALPYRRDHPGGGSAPMPPFPELLRITFDASLKDQVVAAYDEWLQSLPHTTVAPTVVANDGDWRLTLAS